MRLSWFVLMLANNYYKVTYGIFTLRSAKCRVNSSQKRTRARARVSEMITLLDHAAFNQQRLGF